MKQRKVWLIAKTKADNKNFQMTLALEFTDNGFKEATINMFKDLKEKISQWMNKWELKVKNRSYIFKKREKWKFRI
jgi:hypothetical protein